MLEKYAVTHGHENHAHTYALGAMHERQGRHQTIGKHKNALVHHASGYGLSGGHADAYADGAMNEAEGKHADASGE
jgi:hypothetical protein